jgi:hypothetical protein
MSPPVLRDVQPGLAPDVLPGAGNARARCDRRAV